ncbi:MAG TPA: acyltransferase [Cyclobacteriaceae bacterium]|nr:acyltransferase [Cyclobacteriaceae bacterium]
MWYKIRYRVIEWIKSLFSLFSFFYYKVSGANIHTSVSFSKLCFTWPHKVSIGSNSVIEHDVYFKYDGPYSPGFAIIIGKRVFIGAACEFNIKARITIGDDCLIASGCRFIDHDHGLQKKSLLRTQPCPTKEIVIGRDVWIGANSLILKGVSIGDGAVVAGGAVVTKNIGDYEIWGGVPAKKIGERND